MIGLARLENIFSARNYSAFAGFSLVIWLAHFQFGSGSGGFWLLFCLLVSCIYLFINRANSQPLAQWEKVLLALLAVYVLIIFLGGWQLPEGLLGRSAWRAFDNTSRFILLLPFYFAWRKTPIPVYWLLAGAAAGIATVGGMQLWHYAQGSRGIISVTGLHISQGEAIAALGAMLLISAWLVYLQRRSWLSAVLLFFWLLSLSSILLSGTRGAWVAMALCVAMVLAFACANSYKLALVTLVFMFISFVAGYHVIDSNQRDQIRGRVTVAINEAKLYLHEDRFAGSSGLRLLMWHGAMEIVSNKPLGIGSSNFNAAINELADSDPRYNPARRFGHAHNQFLNALVENGWLGLLATLALFFYPSWLCWRAYRQQSNNANARVYAACGLLMLTSFIGSALTQALLSHHSMMLLFVVLLYFCCAQMRAWSTDGAS